MSSERAQYDIEEGTYRCFLYYIYINAADNKDSGKEKREGKREMEKRKYENEKREDGKLRPVMTPYPLHASATPPLSGPARRSGPKEARQEEPSQPREAEINLIFPTEEKPVGAKPPLMVDPPPI